MKYGMAWDILFYFPFDPSLRGIRSILSYPSFGEWYRYKTTDDTESRVLVDVDKLIFDDLYNTGMPMFGSLTIEHRKTVDVHTLAYDEYFDHVKGVPPINAIDENVCKWVELYLSVFEESVLDAYGISKPNRECLELVQEFFIDLSQSTISQVSVKRIHWGYEANSIDDEEVTAELVLSKHLGTILPITHPLATSIRGEELTEGYRLYNWDISELLV